MCRCQLEKSDIAIFEPDLTETTTIARANEFVEAGFQPLVIGFRRARYNCLHVGPWQEIELGCTEDGRYWQRLRSLLFAIPVVVGIRRDLRSRAIFLARNLDQLLVALFAGLLFNRDAIVAYEVVDIQPAFTRSGFRGRLIRAMERVCLSRIDLLAVSSPAFHRDYFHKTQRYRGRWVVVENKLRLLPTEVERALALRTAKRKPIHAGKRWRIGYFGLIRGQTTIELMIRLAIALPDMIEIEFRGIPTTVNYPWFRAMLAKIGNIHYGGEYHHPDDLASLYGGVDLVWAIDLENTEGNSRWLLPCRFYEAGLYGVPCLAVREFEIGRLLDRLDVGWTFADPIEPALVQFFRTLTLDAYERKRGRLLACPNDTFVAGPNEDALSQRLLNLAAAQGLGERRADPAADAALKEKGPRTTLRAE